MIVGNVVMSIVIIMTTFSNFVIVLQYLYFFLAFIFRINNYVTFGLYFNFLTLKIAMILILMMIIMMIIIKMIILIIMIFITT